MLSSLSRFSRQELFVILSIVVMAVAMLLFAFLVHPEIKAYRAVARAEATLQTIASDKSDLKSQLAKYDAEIDELESRLHGDMASLPEKEIEAHIVGKLQQISWHNEVQLIGVEPSAGDTIESFHEILFQVSLAGDYLDMYRWLREVSDELGFVLIKQYEMKALDDVAKNPRLVVNLTMSTYRAAR